jgi:hypothetical protein
VEDSEKIETLRVALRSLYRRVAALEQAGGNGQRSRASKPGVVGRAPMGVTQHRVVRDSVREPKESAR